MREAGVTVDPDDEVAVVIDLFEGGSGSNRARIDGGRRAEAERRTARFVASNDAVV